MRNQTNYVVPIVLKCTVHPDPGFGVTGRLSKLCRLDSLTHIAEDSLFYDFWTIQRKYFDCSETVWIRWHRKCWFLRIDTCWYRYSDEFWLELLTRTGCTCWHVTILSTTSPLYIAEDKYPLQVAELNSTTGYSSTLWITVFFYHHILHQSKRLVFVLPAEGFFPTVRTLRCMWEYISVIQYFVEEWLKWRAKLEWIKILFLVVI